MAESHLAKGIKIFPRLLSIHMW